MDPLKQLPETLLKISDQTPYFQFFFIGSVFVAISLIFDKHFNLVWLFLLLSVAGIIIRYIIRDFLGHYEVKNVKGLNADKIRIRFRILTIYHVFNIAWVIVAFYLLWINK